LENRNHELCGAVRPPAADELEKHFHTDECFVLLQGEAELLTLTGDDLKDAETQIKKTSLLLNTVYCVEKGTWHHIWASGDAKVAVIENRDTSMANTVRHRLKGANA
jgi:mannose-6-phosphate isomerase-like protein (cupin superfamily)